MQPSRKGAVNRQLGFDPACIASGLTDSATACQWTTAPNGGTGVVPHNCGRDKRETKSTAHCWASRSRSAPRKKSSHRISSSSQAPVQVRVASSSLGVDVHPALSAWQGRSNFISLSVLCWTMHGSIRSNFVCLKARDMKISCTAVQGLKKRSHRKTELQLCPLSKPVASEPPWRDTLVGEKRYNLARSLCLHQMCYKAPINTNITDSQNIE